MKRILIAVFVIAVLMASVPAQANRLEDINVAYDKLKVERAELVAEISVMDENLLRLEGMFAERKAVMAEQAAAEVIEEVEMVEEVTKGEE